MTVAGGGSPIAVGAAVVTAVAVGCTVGQIYACTSGASERTYWALTGACPGIALLQLGEGTLSAFAMLAGILAGTRAYDAVNARFLGSGTGTGGD